MKSETQLVKDCLKQNRQAQKELYDRFAETMLGICYRYNKGKDVAEEVLQIGFIKVFKYLGQFKAEGDLGAWIRKIMVNTAINYLKRKPFYQQNLVFEESNLHPVVNESVNTALNFKDLLYLVRQLPTGYQTIFNLYAIEGYTHVEIAKLLGINEGTSRSQYSRARSLLMSWLEQPKLNKQKDSYAG